jgi:tetratricopeptide (TPR) repeat protein
VPRVLALVLFVLVLGSGVAVARPKTDPKLAREAKKHLKAGLKHSQRGKLDKAIEELQIAYSLDPVPLVLFHLAEAHNSKKEYKEALYYYRQYQKEEPKAARKRGVPQIIEALAAMIEQDGEAAREPPPASEPAPVAEPPPSQPAPAEPPPPSASPDPGPDLTARAPAESGGGGGLRVGAYIAAGTGVVLLGAGGYFAWVAHKREGELSDLFAAEGQWSEAYQDRWDQGESARTRAIWLTVAGGAAVTTGAILWFLGRRAGSAVEVGAVPHGGGGEVMARWAF